MIERALLFLDSYHCSDPIFLSRLGRGLRAEHRRAFVIVVGTTELMETRAIGRGDYDPSAPGEREALEGLITELGRRVAASLTEGGVPAVAIRGADRGLVSTSASSLAVRWDKIESIAATGAVTVFASLANSGNSIVPVSPGNLVDALATASGWPVLVFPKNANCDGTGAFHWALDETEASSYYDFEEIRRICSPTPVLATHPGCLENAEISGKWLPGRRRWRE